MFNNKHLLPSIKRYFKSKTPDTPEYTKNRIKRTLKIFNNFSVCIFFL